MNLLILTSSFPRYHGDFAGCFIWDLCKNISKLNFKVIVLAPHHTGLRKKETINGIKIYRFPYFYPYKYQKLCYGLGIPDNIKYYRIARYQVIPLMFNQLLYAIKIVKAENIHVINSHWMIFQGLTGAIIHLLFKIPHILTIHSAGLFALQKNVFGKFIIKFIEKRTDKFLPVSLQKRASLENTLHKKIDAVVLPMGIESGMFTKSRPRKHKSKTLLFVGRLMEIKGIEYLIRAMAIIQSSIHNIQLTVIGSGPLEKELKDLVKKMKLTDTIHFLGLKKHEELVLYYQSCDLVMVPSIIDQFGRTEGMPVVVLEAMASGKPVIASRVGGIPDVVMDGRNGFLTEPKNPGDIADKVIHFFSSGRKNEMEIFARETALKYDWKNIAKRYADVIYDITQRDEPNT